MQTFGAKGGSRTPMGDFPLEPESSASANSATFANNSNKNGASGRNRTTDTQIFSLLLYQLSYRGINLWRPGRDSNPRPPA